LDIPVLCIWGENDRIVPPMPCDVVREYIQNSYSLTIPNGTHLLINEKVYITLFLYIKDFLFIQPALIFKLLTEFLNVPRGEIVDIWSQSI
jgi:hypothetical protein